MKEEKKTISEGDRYAYIFCAIMLIALIASFIYSNNRSKSLKENGEYTKGIIYAFGKNKGNTIKYYYIVDGIKYKNWGRWYPKSEAFSVGDTIVIIYNKKNPAAYSRTKRDFESQFLW